MTEAAVEAQPQRRSTDPVPKGQHDRTAWPHAGRIVVPGYFYNLRVCHLPHDDI